MNEEREERTENRRDPAPPIRRKAREKLNDLFGLPATPGGCMIEMRGRNTLTVGGCRRILSYGEEEITLETKEGVLSVTGRGLTCISYFATDIGIEGEIDGLRFLGEDLAK